MQKTRLGRTNLSVTRTAFGALPIQRVDFETAKKILRAAYDAGINFFDTAIGYSDSEQKIGYALSDVRENIIIATKTWGNDKKTVLEHIETSIQRMKTDYIDILQLHNPSDVPDPNDPNSPYAALLEAKKSGKIRFIGISNHRLDTAVKAVKSGLFDTLQFPLSYISDQKDLDLIDLCEKHDVGLIAMKALCGGLITNAKTAFAFLRQYENVVPIWGIQRESELQEFLELDANPPILDDKLKAEIEKDRGELAGDFCRGCGYCLPCPAEIPIPMAARMSFLLRRAPTSNFLSDEWKKNMQKIENCIHCNACKERCPYELDTPALLKKMYEDYQSFLI